MRSRLAVVIMLSAGLFTSCSVGTDPGECQSLDCLPAQYNLHLTLSTSSDPDFSYRQARGVAAFLRPGDRVSFGSESDRVIPEFVSVNRYDLPYPENGHIFIDTFSDTVLAPPGEYNVWSVIDTGPADLPSILDSIRTPADPIRITAPSIIDTFSISEGFEIRTEGFVDAATPIELSVYQTNWSSEGGTTQFDTLLVSNAHISLTPEMLRRHGIGAGDIVIWVRQEYEKRRWINQGLRSLLTFTLEYDLLITLTD